MKRHYDRRKFIEKSAKSVAAAGLISVSSCADKELNSMGNMFIHHVFFWLKTPVTTEMRQKFEASLRELVSVETIISYHLGIPAPTNRDVIDTSYSYSLLTTFRNKEDQDIYQTHPIHLKFIEDCQNLWERVTVYDSVSIWLTLRIYLRNTSRTGTSTDGFKTGNWSDKSFSLSPLPALKRISEASCKNSSFYSRLRFWFRNPLAWRIWHCPQH